MVPVTGHTHGKAAADRSSGSFFIEKFARNVGRDVVYYQGSESDQRSGRKTSRSYFWAKDLGAAPAPFKPSGGDLVAMVDVCQYVDIPSFLVQHFRPMLLYTFQPSRVARDAGEYDFTFNRQNEVVYHVNGGATYEHEVWNYDTDSVIVHRTFAGKSWFSLWNWIPFVSVIYKIDKKQMDPDHQIILFSPVKRYWFLMSLLSRLVSSNPLKRLKVVHGDFLRLRHKTDKNVMISTGRVNELLCGETTVTADEAISSISRAIKSGLTTAHVKKMMPDNDEGMSVVYEFHSQKLPTASIITYSGAQDAGVRAFQYKPDNYDSEAKASMVSFMNPLVNGGFCPDICQNNAKQAVEGRITKVKSSSAPTKFLMRAMYEFTEMFYLHAGAGKGSLYPVEPEVVYQMQDKPTQRRILELAQFVTPHRMGKSFIKREAYPKITDPRIITVINGTDKYHYSRFIYSFAEVLKQQSWYAFGKNPVSISQRVVKILLEAKTATNTDFSRFDGSISEVPRILERIMMMYGFGDKFHDELNELLRSQQNLPCWVSGGKTDDGVFYESGLARASGSPETSAFNSVCNAFCAFLAFRMTKCEGAFIMANEAYVRLGEYGGDDGLTADVDVVIYARSAKMLGFSLDLENITRGEIGVKFLSRVYGPDVWYGDLTSMCDLRRTLAKFHLTVSMPMNVSNIDKLFDKAYAYYLTDAQTPIIGPFVSAIVSNCRPDYTFNNMCGSWNARYDDSVQYPNAHYPTSIEHPVRPEWMLGVAETEFEGFRVDLLTEWLLNFDGNITYFLSPPSNLTEDVVPIVKEPVVLQGEIIYPKRRDPRNTRGGQSTRETKPTHRGKRRMNTETQRK
jgi:hypothetical protein